MSVSNNIALSRLFTKRAISDLINNENREIYDTIISRYIGKVDDVNNRQIIEYIYKYMATNYRNEYFYQNTLLNKLLLGRHSINTTTALSQVPIENSKADFILINGKAVVYEIKTELDTFDRLETQLNDYYKAFNHVCVVTCESNYNKLYDILEDSKVGIYVLTKKNTIQFRKDPEQDNTKITHDALFKILRKYEYELIILNYFGELPKTTQVFYYEECLKTFKQIPLEIAYAQFLVELKKRNSIKEKDEFYKVPYELKSIIYFAEANSKYYSKLTNFLDEKYRGIDECIIHM